jgi:hypothetical protein
LHRLNVANCSYNENFVIQQKNWIFKCEWK